MISCIANVMSIRFYVLMVLLDSICIKHIVEVYKLYVNEILEEYNF